jgi:hypothetical protein
MKFQLKFTESIKLKKGCHADTQRLPTNKDEFSLPVYPALLLKLQRKSMSALPYVL